MKAITYHDVRKMSVSQKSQPKLKTPTDALLRVTTSGICGSDLHIYDGRTLWKREPWWVKPFKASRRAPGSYYPLTSLVDNVLIVTVATPNRVWS